MIAILVVGTGNMARQHARAFAAMSDVEIAAAVDTNPDSLAEFCAEFGVDHPFATLDEAIAWGGFDAAANVTPDAVHYATTMLLLAADKHVLCEKPLATNHEHALEMAETAEKRGVINMVNLTYRGSPAAVKARQLVAAGEIGEIRHFEAAYKQSWLVSQHWGDWQTEERWLWRLSSRHGSHGVVGDIGVHILDLATFAANQDIVRMQCAIRTFPKTEDDRIGEYVMDANDTFTMMAELEDGAVGVVQATRWATGHANDLTINLHGTKGALRIHTTGATSHLQMCSGDDVHTQTWYDVECPPVPTVYVDFIAAVKSGANAEPSFRRAAKIQRILDLCLQSDSDTSQRWHLTA